MNGPIVIKSKTRLFDLKLGEVLKYKELIWLFVKRNLSTLYKQTVLGPLWLVISPIITTLISAFVFGNIAKISSDGVPYFLFFMCTNSLWSFFASTLSGTSGMFLNNVRLFSKVYFPRLVMPISSTLTNLFNLLVRAVIFVAFVLFFGFNGVKIEPNIYLLILPLSLLQLSVLGIGVGLILTSVTAKYRDITVVIGFGINIWMYITPVIYPLSSLSGVFRKICLLNPVTAAIETVRYGVFGTGEPQLFWFLVSCAVTALLFFLGMVLFNRVEKTFIDTV